MPMISSPSSSILITNTIVSILSPSTSSENKQKSQRDKVYVCGEGNIKYFMLILRA